MNKASILLSFGILALSSMLFAACAKHEETPPVDSSKIAAVPAQVKEGEGKGVVKGIDTTAKTMVLDHNNIPGVMDAMAMEYHLDQPSMLSAAKVGDSVAFTLQDRGEGNFVVTKIQPIKEIAK